MANHSYMLTVSAEGHPSIITFYTSLEDAKQGFIKAAQEKLSKWTRDAQLYTIDGDTAKALNGFSASYDNGSVSVPYYTGFSGMPKWMEFKMDDFGYNQRVEDHFADVTE